MISCRTNYLNIWSIISEASLWFLNYNVLGNSPNCFGNFPFLGVQIIYIIWISRNFVYWKFGLEWNHMTSVCSQKVLSFITSESVKSSSRKYPYFPSWKGFVLWPNPPSLPNPIWNSSLVSCFIPHYLGNSNTFYGGDMLMAFSGTAQCSLLLPVELKFVSKKTIDF